MSPVSTILFCLAGLTLILAIGLGWVFEKIDHELDDLDEQENEEYW